MALLLTKIFPALAGSFVRNLFPPRKPILQRFGEALGGVVMVIYAGPVAGGALWAALGWAMAFVNAKQSDVIQRAESDLLAAFLIGLIGMTLVEGAIAFTRAWMKTRATM